MRVHEIKPGIYACLMANKTANAGFVITDRGVIVIDSLSTPDQGRELAKAIEARTDKQVRFVLNTHYHYDHLFGNQAFDAPVVAHCALSGQLAKAAARDLMPVAVAAWISEHREDRWLADELELVYPSITFECRIVFDLPPFRLVVRHLGGHTPDSCIVDLPEEGVLFAGDLVFEGRVPYLRNADIEDTVAALRRLELLGERIIVPGHGALCDQDYVARVRAYTEDLQETIAELIAQGLDKADILDSDRLPRWWTEDRRELMRANVERIYEELTGSRMPT